MAGTTTHGGPSVILPLAAFGAGAVVSLLLGVYGTVHEPTFGDVTLGLASTLQMKVLLSTVVGTLAVVQLVGALWLYGRLPFAAPGWLGSAHRWTGRVALLASLPVAYACLWSLGFQAGDGATTRVAVHSLAGCTVYGAVVVKVVAVRSGRAPGWMLPVAGGLLFAALVTVTWTSSGWYVAEYGWPSG